MTTEMAEQTPEPNGTPTISWNDVVKASAEVDAARVETEIVEDVIEVRLADTDLADIARANAADDQEKTERQRKVDDLKSKLKDEKSAIESLDARMRDRNNSVRKGTHSRKDKWIVESTFSTNTVRYLDPVTKAVVLERPMHRDERQTSLPLVSPEAAEKATQLSLGDVEPTDITDAEALLADAQKGDEVAASSRDLEDDDSDDADGDDSDDEDEL